jgi:hypothetical protein
MQCFECGREVHPVQEMLEGKEGNMRGFSNRCPHIECRAHLPPEEPTTVQADSSEEITMLESELAILETEDATEENAQAKARVKARLHRLRNPRPVPAAPPKIQKVEIVKSQPAPPLAAPVVAAVPIVNLGGTDIVTLLRSELERIEIQATKIRAMLAAADAVS